MRTIFFVVVSLAYPLAVWAALGRFEPRWMALLLFALAALRALGTRDPVWMAIAAAAAVLAAMATVLNAATPLKLYPVAVNAMMLLVFATSLLRPPSVIERIARRSEPELSPAGVVYTRRVTWVWCAFFLINGSIALATALCASTSIWALYNGLIAYGLIGLLFAGEWLVRQRVRAAQHHD